MSSFRYFALRNLAVRVYSDPIEVLEVCPPPLEIKVHADVRARLRLDEMRSMSNRFDAFWTSLHQRLNAINLESCASDKVEEARRIIESFHQRFEFEQSQIKRMLFETYRDSVSSSGLSFADVRRTMQEKVVEWDAAFASFEQSFLPTEKDLRRLTGTQLRKLFDSGPSQATESRITSPLLSPAVEEKEASDDGLDSLSLLSLPDVPSGLPLSEANLAAIDFKLGDLPSSRPATAGATIVRTYSAPLLPAPSQTGINSKAIDNPLPVAIQESTESAESDTGSDTTVCADLPVSSQSGVVQSEQAPHLERTGSASSAKTSATPIASQSGHSRPSQISSHGVSDLVRQFDLSSPPSRAREDSFSETEVRRPVFKRGHSDYARAMAYSKKRSGTITDPESLPSSRPRSPESKGLSKRHKEPSQNAGRERPNLSRGNTARLHTCK